jgi:hypothetical protein
MGKTDVLEMLKKEEGQIFQIVLKENEMGRNENKMVRNENKGENIRSVDELGIGVV